MGEIEKNKNHKRTVSDWRKSWCTSRLLSVVARANYQPTVNLIVSAFPPIDALLKLNTSLRNDVLVICTFVEMDSDIKIYVLLSMDTIKCFDKWVNPTAKLKKKTTTGHDIPVLNYNEQKCHQLLFKPIWKVFFSIKKAYCISVRAYDTSIEVKDQTNEGRNTTGD